MEQISGCRELRTGAHATMGFLSGGFYRLFSRERIAGYDFGDRITDVQFGENS
jgi:hypothetical protein